MTNPLQGSDEETQAKQTTRDLLMTVRRALPFSSSRPKTHAAYEAIDELLDRAQKEAEARDSLESALREAQKDAERLDWLNEQAVQDGVDLDGIEPSSDAPVVCVTLRKPVRNREYEAPSLRAAIDAAISGEGTI